METRINNAVFPACQGGPHNHVRACVCLRRFRANRSEKVRRGEGGKTIAAIAVTLKQAVDPTFVQYAKQVIDNAQTLSKYLSGKGYKLQTDGTDNHLALWDLRPLGLTGSKVEKVCDLAHITLNKNAVTGDTSAATPGGVRIGTSALTSRSMKEAEMETVGAFLDRAVQIALKLQKEAGSKKLAHGPVAANWECDGLKIAERWWFA